jgi:hypothetical protein
MTERTARRRRRNGALLHEASRWGESVPVPAGSVRLYRRAEFDEIVMLVEPECPDPIGPVEFACTRLATAAGER